MPNVNKLTVQLDTSRELCLKMLYALDRAELIQLLTENVKDYKHIITPEKIYLNNTNLMRALAPRSEIGTVRETFFANQTSAVATLTMPKKGDFLLNGTSNRLRQQNPALDVRIPLLGLRDIKLKTRGQPRHEVTTLLLTPHKHRAVWGPKQTDMDKNETYKLLLAQVKAMVKDESDPVANMANVAALIQEAFHFWWTGFYRVIGEQLVLGPFQGPVACTRIGFGKGVCGTSWKERKTLVVEDVEQFPGHIACSSESKSEIVVPLIKQGEVIGVLDIDSERLATFDQTDKEWLEQIAEATAAVL